MTITPEQFNKIALKQDLDDLKKELKEDLASKEDINKVLTAVDNITKKHQDHQTEHTANIAAHDRMQGEINETREKIGLKIKSQTIS